MVINRRSFLSSAAMFALAGCAGRGTSGRDEVLAVANSGRPNSALIFWPSKFIAGLERMAFYQGDKTITSVSRGQIAVLPLAPGRNHFDVGWEEAMDLPVSGETTITANPKAPTYMLVGEDFKGLLRRRFLAEVPKQVFLAEIGKHYQKSG